MPPKNRQYARQNLERAQGHIDDIQNYLIAVGLAFVEQGSEHYGNVENFPSEYQAVIAAVDTFTELCQTLREGIQSLHDSI